MEHLPIPLLYRVTNNHLCPDINSTWINDNGDIVKIVEVLSKKNPIIVSYKNMENKKINNEKLSLSLHKFYSIFF